MSVGSVSNAVAILRHLVVNEPTGVNAIARALQISPSSCFNILKTLAAEGLIDFDQTSKAYRPGLGLAELAPPRIDHSRWIDWVHGKTSRIAETFNASCGLWRIGTDRSILVDVADCLMETRIHLSKGQRLPKYIGAMGRCIASHERLDAGQVKRLLDGLRWQLEPSLDAYMVDMNGVVENGWAVDDGHYLRGVATVAAPIVDQDAKVAYCLTSTAFSGQLDEAATRSLGSRLAALAADAGRRLDSF